ncbi:hypothetical protein GE061_007790 [Apolygus lucorum]|uniref:Uncharacterized protein n=1 Tax=Apolygus lucorum TaxID=248454 RepID=A0A8S9WP96_APOLU|nr:hypothetical protein GE061_007790 [Apolygus lucorum]
MISALLPSLAQLAHLTSLALHVPFLSTPPAGHSSSAYGPGVTIPVAPPASQDINKPFHFTPSHSHIHLLHTFHRPENPGADPYDPRGSSKPGSPQGPAWSELPHELLLCSSQFPCCFYPERLCQLTLSYSVVDPLEILT